jgi:outer membrane receptor protein involved in Fe transport
VTKIKGVELEGVAQLTDELQVSGGYAYTDSKVPPTINPFKNQLEPVYVVFTPKNAWNAAVDYVVPVPAGTHLVVFKYRPRSSYPALFALGAFVLVAIALGPLLWRRWSNRRKSRPSIPG